MPFEAEPEMLTQLKRAELPLAPPSM